MSTAEPQNQKVTSLMQKAEFNKKLSSYAKTGNKPSEYSKNPPYVQEIVSQVRFCPKPSSY